MTRRREFAWAAAFAAGAVALAVAGEPRPLALVVAGVAALTAAYIAFRTYERGPT